VPRVAGPAQYRLTGSSAFEHVFHAGRRREGNYLQVVFAPARAEIGRVGYVIGRKALSRAVDRNRIRRMLRPIVHAARWRLEGYDVIVRLKKASTRAEFPVIAAEAQRLLEAMPVRGSES